MKYSSNSLGILSDTLLNQSKSEVHVQTVLSSRAQCQKILSVLSADLRKTTSLVTVLDLALMLEDRFQNVHCE